MEKIKKECIGKSVCQMSDLKKLFEPAGTCIKEKLFLKRNLFLQVSCGKDEEMMKEVSSLFLIYACVSISGLLIFIITMKHYYRGSMKILKRQHQSFSCSAKDYSLEI